MAAVPDTVECSTWCWLCCSAEQMLKFVWLLKAIKHSGVASRALVCYLAVRQKIILHKMINMKKG